MTPFRILRSCSVIALAAYFAASQLVAQQTVSKYTALVRVGDATRDDHFADLPKDSKGEIAELEVQCTPRVYYSQFLKGLRELATESITFDHGFSVADSACFIDKHYRVWFAPRPDNAKRCVVLHVPVSVAQSCFRPYGEVK